MEDPAPPTLVDTHCHLTNARFADDLPEVIARARAAGVGRCLVIGTGVDDALRGLELAERWPGYLANIAGLDPFSCHEACTGADALAAPDEAGFVRELARLRALLLQGRHCALGEIGLEYHHQLLPHPLQVEHFERQLALALEVDLPVVIHVRDAHHDLLAALRRNPRNRGVIHSFIGDAATAREYLDLGWHLSFNGTVTFKANGFLREAAALVPNDRLLVETDSPYLAPHPLRGRRCEPAFVAHTLALLAELRGQRPEDLADWTTRTARLLFRLPEIIAG